jgi:hypothetical protein
MDVLWPSVDLIARKIKAKEQNLRSAEMLVDVYEEKTGKFVNPEFI